MSSANNTLSESIGLVVAANASVQDPDVVGTALRTISLRLRNTAGDLEELNEDADGAAESITKLQTQILNLTGGAVNIIEEDGKTFRSTYDILVDLSKVWGELSDIQQADIVRLVAGTRQANVFNSIMANMKDAIEATATAENSRGSAMRENAVYIDSIEGKLKSLTATFEEFSVKSLSSGTVKFFIDLAKSVLDFINATGGLTPILITLSGTLLAVFGPKMLGGIVKFLKNIRDIPLAFRTATEEGAGFSGVLNLLGIKASAAQIAIGLATFAITALVMAISFANSKHEEFIRKTQEAAQKAKEESDSLNKLIASYQNLSKSGGSADELRSIQEQITALVGKQAEGLDLVNGKYDEQIQKLQTISAEQAKQNIAQIVAANNIAQEKFKNPGSSQKGLLGTDVGEYNGFISAEEYKILSDIDNLSIGMSNSSMWVDTFGDAKQRLDAVTEALEKLEKAGKTTGSLYTGLAFAQKYYQEIVDGAREASSAVVEYLTITESANIDQSKYDTTTEEGFQQYRNALIDAVKSNKLYSDSMGDVTDKVDAFLAAKFPQFADSLTAISDNTDEASSMLSELQGKLKDITSTMSPLQKVVDEYNKNGELSVSTIQDIIENTPELLKYITESGGKYKLTQQAVDDLSTAQSQYNDLLDEYLAKIKESEFGSTQFAKDQIDFLSAINDAYGKTDDRLVSYINKLKEINQALLDGKSTVIDYFNELQKQINTIDWSGIDSNQGLQALFANLSLSTAEGLGYINQQFKSGKINVDQYSDALVESNENLLDLLKSYYKTKRGAWKPNTKEIQEYVAALEDAQTELKAFDEFSNIISDNFNYISQNMDALGNAAFDSADLANSSYRRLVTDVGGWLTELSKAHKDTYDGILQQVEEVTGKTYKSVEDINKDMLSNANTTNAVLGAGVDSMGTALGKVAKAAGNVIIALGNAIKSFDYTISMVPYISTRKVTLPGLFGQNFSFALPSINFDIRGKGGASVQAVSDALLALGSSMSGLGGSISLSNWGTSGGGGSGSRIATPTGSKSGGSGGGGSKSSSSSTNTALQNRLDEIEHNKAIGKYALNEQQYIKDLEDAYKRLAKTKEEKWNLEEKIYTARKQLQEDELNRIKDRYDAAQAAVISSLDAEVKRIQDKIDALKKQNEEQDRANELEEAAQRLADAKKNKTVLMYHAGQGFVYETDAEAIKEAQKAYDDLKLEQQISEYEAQIEKLEEYKSKWSEIANVNVDAQNRIIAAQMLGADWEKNILNQRLDTLNKFASKYKDVVQKIENLQTSGIKVSSISATLKSGSKGEDVKTLQKVLREMGYSVDVTGTFDSKTKSALQAFQKNAGIQQTGVLDANTKAKFKIMGFKQGGPVDYTGLGWLDGSYFRAETIFSSADSKKLYDYVHNAPSLISDLMHKVKSNVVHLSPALDTAGTSVVFAGDIILPNVENATQFAQEMKQKVANIFRDVRYKK